MTKTMSRAARCLVMNEDQDIERAIHRAVAEHACDERSARKRIAGGTILGAHARARVARAISRMREILAERALR